MIRIFRLYIQDTLKMLKLGLPARKEIRFYKGVQLPSMTHLFLGSLVVVVVIALPAIAFDYSGSIQLHLGVDGIQLQIDGGE